MGCFLACLGSSKDKKGKRRQSNKIPAGARYQRRGYNPVEQVVYPDESFKQAQQVDLLDEDVKPAQEDRSLDERKLDSSTSLVSVLRNKAADEFSAGSNEISQLESSPKKSNLASLGSLSSSSREKSADRSSSGAKKKVSFNSVVKTYEPVPICELLDEVLQREGFSEKEKIGAEAQPSKSKSISESGSNSSSLMSYPPNHRYQNCRESDDEEEELDYEESDMDFDDDDDDGIFEESEYSDGEVLTDSLCSMGSTTKTSPEVNSNRKTCDTKDSSLIARGREGYDHSVLNPVENLSQWKALKSIGKPPPQQPQKENSALDFKKPPAISFSHEPKFNQAASLKSKMRQPEHQTQQMAVDASLSNWLMSPEPPRKSNASTVAFHNVIPQQTASQSSYSSYSPKSLDDRPILGALTVEEIKLITRNSSPRKSPSKSPDDMAIIGSVGSYWSNEKSDKDSSLVSSHKGIPNTTRKYQEDMRVNWDSTPFETRLEKALSEGSAEA